MKKNRKPPPFINNSMANPLLGSARCGRLPSLCFFFKPSPALREALKKS